MKKETPEQIGERINFPMDAAQSNFLDNNTVKPAEGCGAQYMSGIDDCYDPRNVVIETTEGRSLRATRFTLE